MHNGITGISKPFVSDLFDSTFATLLQERASTVRKILEHVDTALKSCSSLDFHIVETNTCRWPPDWEEDGHSTGLFDSFLCQQRIGTLHSIDADHESGEQMRPHLQCARSSVICADPVEWLLSCRQPIDVLYLTSVNVAWENEHDAEFQHIKEFFAAKSLLTVGSMVVVDGGPPRCHYLTQLLQELGAECAFESSMQCGWILRDRVPCIVNIAVYLDKYGMAEDITILQAFIQEAACLLQARKTDRQIDPTDQNANHKVHVRRVKIELDRLRHDLQLADINIFLEMSDEGRLASAPVNVWMPNVEYFHQKHYGTLSFIDHILAKSQFSQSVMRRLVDETQIKLNTPCAPMCHIHYTGFTTSDCAISELWPTRNWNEFLCIGGGNSERRQVQMVLETWQQHKDLPPLTIVCQTLKLTEVQMAAQLPNVRIIEQYVPRVSISEMENYFGMHLCTTQAEGFGHSINEVRACGAMTIVTDGPPMNELVDSACGILINCTRSNSNWFNVCSQIPRCEITSSQLYEALTKALSLTVEQKQAYGRCARQRYLEEQKQVQARFAEAWAKVSRDVESRFRAWLRALHSNHDKRKIVNYRQHQPSFLRHWERESDGNVFSQYDLDNTTS